MTSIQLTITGAYASASVTGPLTSGMVGIPVMIKCDESWEGLTKNLMCRCSPWGSNSGEVRAILNVGESAVVAHEVMQPDMYLYLGIEGFSDDGRLLIPTTWARCGKIEYGANTYDDPTTDPELSIWNQLQIEMEQTKEYVLTPEEAANIQSYAQEARQAAEEAKQAAESGLYYIPIVSQPTDNTLKFEFNPSITDAPVPKPVTVTLPTKFETLKIGAADADGVYIQSDGTAEAPTLDLYGEHGDEPVRLRNLAEAVDDSDAPTLAQVRELVRNNSGASLNLLDVEPGEEFTLADSGDSATYGEIVMSTASETVDEGGTVTFTVKLASAPSGTQTVSLSVSNTDVTLDTTKLTFDADNYATAQTVTATVIHDDDAADDACTITARSYGVTSKELLLTITDLDEDTPPSSSHYTYIFDINETTNADKTLTMVLNENGTGETDWGDGTVDTELTHIYADYGTYTVVTDNTMATGQNTPTRLSLTRVESMSLALMVNKNGTQVAQDLFSYCTNLVYACDMPAGYKYMNSTFLFCNNLANAPKIPAGCVSLNGTFWSCGFSTPPAIPTSVTDLQNAFRGAKITVAPQLHSGITNCSSMCDGCKYLTDTLEPWNIEFTAMTEDGSVGCFANCTLLDLSTVPTTWGGTMEVTE